MEEVKQQLVVTKEIYKCTEIPFLEEYYFHPLVKELVKRKYRIIGVYNKDVAKDFAIRVNGSRIFKLTLKIEINFADDPEDKDGVLMCIDDFYDYDLTLEHYDPKIDYNEVLKQCMKLMEEELEELSAFEDKIWKTIKEREQYHSFEEFEDLESLDELYNKSEIKPALES